MRRNVDFTESFSLDYNMLVNCQAQCSYFRNGREQKLIFLCAFKIDLYFLKHTPNTILRQDIDLKQHSLPI